MSITPKMLLSKCSINVVALVQKTILVNTVLHTSYRPVGFFVVFYIAQNRPSNFLASQLNSIRTTVDPILRTHHSPTWFEVALDSRNGLDNCHSRVHLKAGRAKDILVLENAKSNASCFWYNLAHQWSYFRFLRFKTQRKLNCLKFHLKKVHLSKNLIWKPAPVLEWHLDNSIDPYFFVSVV